MCKVISRKYIYICILNLSLTENELRDDFFVGGGLKSVLGEFSHMMANCRVE